MSKKLKIMFIVGIVLLFLGGCSPKVVERPAPQDTYSSQSLVQETEKSDVKNINEVQNQSNNQNVELIYVELGETLFEKGDVEFTYNGNVDHDTIVLVNQSNIPFFVTVSTNKLFTIPQETEKYKLQNIGPEGVIISKYKE